MERKHSLIACDYTIVQCLPRRISAMAVLLLALSYIAFGAHAAPTVYRCIDANGSMAFQDTPCAANVRQKKLDLRPLPTIGDPTGSAAGSHREQRARERQRATDDVRPRRTSTRHALVKTATSWECRAADGEVFYRHTRCPGSVPGDGTVRSAYAEKMQGSRTRSRQGAWGRVPVHGTKISREEACRRIHSAGAAGRDGHARDETVSTYDHLMGRDPCSGT
ncbi:MAG TPA: DUF4124 domain-containing protein [Rhodanobacteraceae bacterium]|jgi:hypothetical protein|nr:DUF4124 domain-containing protein [Rhodanobacteraceae bacterium]